MGKRVQQVLLKNLSTETLRLGYVGENVHTQIVFSCLEIYSDYPNAAATLVVQNPRGEVYPAVISRDGSRILWDITSSDVVYPGGGRIQLTFTNGNEIIRSVIGSLTIEESIETTGEAPDPLEDWIANAEATASEIAQNAATEASGAINNLTVSATSGDPGATISNVSGHKHITFTLPIPTVSGHTLVFS